MSWKRHLRIVNASQQAKLPPSGGGNASSGTSSKFSSYLPEVYAGHPNRIQRYYQYEDMDRDADVAIALDTIADFCTQSEEQAEEPFLIHYTGEATETEVRLLSESLSKWVKLNDFKSRLWQTFRNCIKNGDSFFLRDPETGEWLWQDHYSVEMIKVNDEDGKEPEEYFIRSLDYIRQQKFAGSTVDPSQYRTPFGSSNTAVSRPTVAPYTQQANVFSLAGANRDPRQMRMMGGQQNELWAVDADHVIHLSLSVGMDINWPFGQSILEQVYKVYKQREILEDSVIIYRVQRAPERRIFYIDTGAMPPPRAKAHIEQIKNEIHQRRIPSRTGGGSSILDAAYNPLGMVEDYFFAQGCFRLDTKVPLLDGRTLTFAEIIAEHEDGKQNHIYSLNPQTHEFEPGRIAWAGITRKDAEMVRVHLDNGEHVDVTPDHRFVLRDGTERAAEDLAPGTSLMPLYRFEAMSGKGQPRAAYERILCNRTGKKVFTHTAVCPKPKGREWVVHHKDLDSRNNNPDNLEAMRWHDHEALHKHLGSYSLGRQWKDPEARARLITGMNRLYADATPEFRERLSVRNRVNGQRLWSTEHADDARQRHRENLRGANRRRKLTYTPEMFERVRTLFDEGHTSVVRMSRALRADPMFRTMMQATNSGVARKAGEREVGTWADDGTLNEIVGLAGFASWGDFKQSYARNHKVVQVELLVEREDTADLTVDAASGSHWFALAAGVYVHNSDGRGSKVETLPGGELVGEIGDLLHFSRKLARGLRVPPSYLSLGTEDSQVAYNDGKLGQAMIQEFRFSKYCLRLQGLLAPNFDREFKRFLRESGIEVESNIFELRFFPPQNFTKYRQIELDTAQLSVYGQVADNRKISERFKFRRYLGWTDEDIIENERMWREENPKRAKNSSGQTAAEETPGADLSSVGIRPSPDFGDDLGMPPMDEPPPDEGGGPGGAPGAGPVPAGGPGGPPPMGGAGGVSINPAGGGAI